MATSPIAAAGQVSRATQAWWPRLAASTAQLIVLKPVIALVFCVGFSLTGNSTDVQTLLAGMLVLVLAVLAWPAVARFFTFASAQVGGGAGLGAVIGFAAARMTAGPGGPAGVEPDEFSRRIEARTMAGLENTPLGAATPGAVGVGTAGGADTAGRAGMAAMGPAGLAATAATAAQRAANALTGRMEQMAGHAGIAGANPYAQPAGPPRQAGHPVRRAVPVPDQPGPHGGPAGPSIPPPGAGPGPDAGPPGGGGHAPPGGPPDGGTWPAPGSRPDGGSWPPDDGPPGNAGRPPHTGTPPHPQPPRPGSQPAPPQRPDQPSRPPEPGPATPAAPPLSPPEIHHEWPGTPSGGAGDTERGSG